MVAHSRAGLARKHVVYMVIVMAFGRCFLYGCQAAVATAFVCEAARPLVLRYTCRVHMLNNEALRLYRCLFASDHSLEHCVPIVLGLRIAHSNIGFDALCPCGFASRSSLGHVLPNRVRIVFCVSKCILEP